MQASAQATVKHFDPLTRSGAVLFDDGRELPFDAAAFDRGGLLKLRLGQRVRLSLRQEAPSADATAAVGPAIPVSAEPRSPETQAEPETPEPAGQPSTPGLTITALTIATMAFPAGVDSTEVTADG